MLKRKVSLILLVVFSITILTLTSAQHTIVEMELFMNHTWWWLKEWKGSVPEEITRRTGVRIRPIVAADDNQLLVLIASGDLPELIYTDNKHNLHQRLADPKLCHAWNDLIAKYAPDFKIDKIRIALYTQEDGKFYTILNNFSTKEEWEREKYALPRAGGLAVREDILAKLGNPKIENLNDLLKVFEMVKKQFPHLIPLVLNTNWTGLKGQSGYFLNVFGLMSGGFSKDKEGRVVYYIKEPNRLDYYKFYNLLYRRGYIVPENFAFTNEEQSFEYAWNLRCFAYAKMNDEGTADDLNRDMKRFRHPEVRWRQIIKPLDKRFKVYNTSIGWSGVFITKKNKNPDKAINFMKFLYSQEGQRLAMWGIEGKHWVMTKEGYPKFDEKLADWNYVNTEGIRWWGLLIGDAVTEALFNYQPAKEQSVAAAYEIKKHMVFDPALGMLTPEPGSEEEKILLRLNEMVKSEEIKIITAKSEAECIKAYTNMLALAQRIGISKLEKWANEKYKKVSALFKD